MDYENELTDYIITLLEQNPAVDVAEAEFKRIIADDAEIRDQYREWCAERGYTLRHGFTDFAEEYNEQRDSVWESLNDYDDNE